MRRHNRFLVIVALMIALLGGVNVWASPPRQASLFEAFILQIRVDMEALANDVLGEGVRPGTWTFNANLQSTTFVSDLWFDNEQLADTIFGVGTRSATWFGVTSPNPELVARNVRHDLEISADAVYGPRTRPPTWNGAAAIFSCDRTLQNLTRLLDTLYNTRSTVPQSAVDYCGAVRLDVQNNLINTIFSASALQSELPALILALRGDLERLADEALGVNQRPPTWTNNRDENSPTLLADIGSDLETLANLQLGNNIRPQDWFGFINNAPATSYRNLRYNLETLTNLSLGEGVRPRGWQGVDPLEECDPIEQGLFFVVEQNYGNRVDLTIGESPNYCQLVSFTANDLAENPPPALEEEIAGEDSRFLGESQYAFSYLDQAALQYMGVMPAGIQFRAWYRNFNESTMMFVSGDNFAVYIDRRWTSLPEEVFNTLPTLDGVRPLTFCDAYWCNGPGPTPTPTGGSPLELLVSGATPPPTIDAAQAGQQTGKTQVSWNHIRVTYLLDRPETGTVQVALEICAEPAQIACEPVISVFDNSIGANKPVLSQFNGLNVYEFRYGYSTNVIIEGATRVSPDIWISDPTIR